MEWIRGNKHDFNSWAQEGLKGWSYHDVLPYFKKSEKVRFQPHDHGYHGHTGPVHVEHSRPVSETYKMIVNANDQLHYKLRDYNGREQLGIGRLQQHSDDGDRDTTGNAYIDVLQKRSNVKLLGQSYVTKILIHPHTKQAYGVEFMRHNKVHRVKARREIILSAGPISSPQLLMLSGVGPAEHLRHHKIHVIKDLPVGKFVRTHPAFDGLFFNTHCEDTPIKGVRSHLKDYLHGFGAYTLCKSFEAVGFYQSRHCKTNVPDLVVSYSTPHTYYAPHNVFTGFSQTAFDSLYNNMHSKRTLRTKIVNVNPKSKGTIKLRSNCPYDYPIINPNLFAQKEDAEVLYEGVKTMLRLLDTESFKKFKTTLGRIELPACKHHECLSKGYWMCLIKHYTSIQDIFASCRMGTETCQGAVVDYHLRVNMTIISYKLFY